MALFKVLRGSSGSFHDDLSQFHNWGADGSATLISNGAIALNPKFNDGFCYFLKDSRMFYIDYAIKDGNGNITERHRVPLNADDAQSIENTIINRLEITDSDYEIPTAKLIKEEIARIDLLISQIGGDAIEALQNNKMDKEDPTGTGSFSMNGGKATGTNSVAWADASNTPEYTTASGYNAFAMGLGSTASGHLSFARGETAIASGDYSHADGYHVNATQSYTHAEGNNTTASAQGAHAEGEYTTASGQDAHTEGYYTEAQGKFSHAEGNYTTATHKSQHVEGEWNALDTSTNAATDRGTYVHITGIGTGESDRKNGFTVDWSGNLWGARSLGHGNNVSASGENSYAGGNAVVASGVSSHAEGSNNEARGSSSHTEGDSTYASSRCSHAEGKSTKATGTASHAEGQETQATNEAAHAEGCKTTASGNNSHAEGYGTVAEGEESHAEGCRTTASGNNSHAEGYETVAEGEQSHAEGSSTTASGESAHAEGDKTVAEGKYSHAEGASTTASGSYSHAEGSSTTASGRQAHAEGDKTVAEGEESHAEGYKTVAEGERSHAEGSYTLARGDFSHAEGSETQAQDLASHAEGQETQATNEAAHAEGHKTVAEGRYSHAEGYKTVAEGERSHAEGGYTLASGRYSHTEGGGFIYEYLNVSGVAGSLTYTIEAAVDFDPTDYYLLNGQEHGRIVDYDSSALTITLDKTINADLDLTNVEVGIVAYTESAGERSHAEGKNAIAFGEVSHAEGLKTRAYGNYSHAGGEVGRTKGIGSFAHGLYVTADGDYSTVFGKYNTLDTDKTFAFAIGNGTANDDRKNIFQVAWDGSAYLENRLNIAGLELEQDAAGYTLFVNGPAFFSGTVKTAEPVEANDVTTKNYVDNNLPRMTHSWITATAGQSVFDFAAPDTGCPAVTDLANYYYVYFNGLLLIPGLHYTVSGATVTFVGWAAEAGDVCHIVGFKPINPTV